MLRFILIRSKSQKYCVYAYAAKTKCVPYALTTYYALQLQQMNGSHAPPPPPQTEPKNKKIHKRLNRHKNQRKFRRKCLIFYGNFT